MQEYGIEKMLTVVEKAAKSSFMIERQLGFDWMFRPNNFPKVLEGNYDNRQLTNGNGTNRTDTSREQRQAEAAELVASILARGHADEVPYEA